MTVPPRKWRLAALYELPLGFASLALFASTRWGLQVLVRRYNRRRAAQVPEWQPISAGLLAKPGALPVLLTTAPRWNPHALIATAGPFEVKGELAVLIDVARSAAAEWFLVLYSYPDRTTVGTVSCLGSAAAGWHAFPVPGPGLYMVGARYYGARPGAAFPPLRRDGADLVAAGPAPDEINDFYSSLSSRGTAFHAALAYHAYVFLKYPIFSDLWLNELFLPVGNPETIFRYGRLEAGETVNCRMDSERFETHRLFVTIYSCSSLPVLWYEVGMSTGQSSPPSPTRGFYLVRLQPRRPGAPALSPQEDHGLVTVMAAPAGSVPALA